MVIPKNTFFFNESKETYSFIANSTTHQLFQAQERALYKQLDKEEDPNDVYMKMMKMKEENTTMAPHPLSNHYDILKSTGTWQNFDKKN